MNKMVTIGGVVLLSYASYKVGKGVGYAKGVLDVAKVVEKSVKTTLNASKKGLIKDISREQYSKPKEKSGLYYYNFSFLSLAYAENVLSGLRNIIDQFQFVTLKDLNDLTNKPSTIANQMYGWKNLDSATISRMDDGFQLRLPKLEKLH